MSENELERQLREERAQQDAEARTRHAGRAAQGLAPVKFSPFDAAYVARLHGYERPLKRSGFRWAYPWQRA